MNEKWWDAYVHIARYAAPLIGEMSRKTGSHPNGMTLDEWREILTKVHHSLSVIADDKVIDYDSSVEEGMALFGRWFTHMWD